MIQDIEPKKLLNPFRGDAEAGPDDRVVVCYRKKYLLRLDAEQGLLDFPAAGELPEEKRKELVYLFSIDGEGYYLLTDGETFNGEGYEWYGVFEAASRQLRPRERVYALFTAHHLAEWYADNRFCGRCGAPMVRGESERVMACPACGKKVYPRINPAVIVGVVSGDRILITQYREGYGRNALIAGFTEIGETVEQTVAREVMEETGLRVKNIRYYKSQPWGLASDILMGYYCEPDGDETITMDRSELRYAQWVRRDELVLQPTDYSLTNEMMDRFRRGETC